MVPGSRACPHSSLGHLVQERRDVELPRAHTPVHLTGCRRAVDNAPAWLFQVLDCTTPFPSCASPEEAGRAEEVLGPIVGGLWGTPLPVCLCYHLLCF